MSRSRGQARTLEIQDVIANPERQQLEHILEGIHIWKGLTSFHKMFACLRPLANPKTKPCHQGFQTRARFAHVSTHVSPTFRNDGAFSVSGVYIGLALGTLPCNLRHWGWNLKVCGSFRQFCQAFGAQNFSIQVTLGTAAWTSGSLSA